MNFSKTLTTCSKPKYPTESAFSNLCAGLQGVKHCLNMFKQSLVLLFTSKQSNLIMWKECAWTHFVPCWFLWFFVTSRIGNQVLHLSVSNWLVEKTAFRNQLPSRLAWSGTLESTLAATTAKSPPPTVWSHGICCNGFKTKPHFKLNLQADISGWCFFFVILCKRFCAGQKYSCWWKCSTLSGIRCVFLRTTGPKNKFKRKFHAKWFWRLLTIEPSLMKHGQECGCKDNISRLQQNVDSNAAWATIPTPRST